MLKHRFSNVMWTAEGIKDFLLKTKKIDFSDTLIFLILKCSYDQKTTSFFPSDFESVIAQQKALFTIAVMLVFILSCKLAMRYAGGQTLKKKSKLRKIGSTKY